MNETPMASDRCRNEACARAAEPGELWCGECGLERSLYRRDDRRDENRARRGGPEAGG